MTCFNRNYIKVYFSLPPLDSAVGLQYNNKLKKVVVKKDVGQKMYSKVQCNVSQNTVL